MEDGTIKVQRAIYLFEKERENKGKNPAADEYGGCAIWLGNIETLY